VDIVITGNTGLTFPQKLPIVEWSNIYAENKHNDTIAIHTHITKSKLQTRQS